MTASQSIFLEPEFVFLLAIIAATIGFAVLARRRRIPLALVAVAAIDLFCGAVIVPLGTAHLVAVVGRALAGKGSGPGGTFVYNFRFYSLMLVGVMLVAAGAACLTSVRRLMRGDAAGHRLALWATVALLALNVPLMPIQGFAVGFSAFALVNLAALWLTRTRFRVSLGPVAAGNLPGSGLEMPLTASRRISR